MNKPWTEMTPEEREAQKTLHRAVRADMRAARGHAHRYLLLAWAFVREMPFRRVERSHHVQDMGGDKTFEHNMPSAFDLTKVLARYRPAFEEDFASKWSLKPGGRVEAWLADPSGAIPAPAPRPKKPYERQAVAAE